MRRSRGRVIGSMWRFGSVTRVVASQPDPGPVYVACQSGWCDAAAEHPPAGTPVSGRGHEWECRDGVFGGEWFCPSCVRALDAQERAIDATTDLEALRAELDQVRVRAERAEKVIDDANVLWRGRRAREGADVDAPFMREALFAEAMAHELAMNAWKGEWRRTKKLALAEDLVYHALKLVLAVEHEDEPRILEFAADTGNLAMMVCDVTEVLRPGLFDDRDAQQRQEAGKYDPPAYRGRIEHVRRMVPGVVRETLGATAREMQLRELEERHPSGQIPSREAFPF